MSLNTLFWKICMLLTSLSVRGKASTPYRAIARINPSYTSIFNSVFVGIPKDDGVDATKLYFTFESLPNGSYYIKNNDTYLTKYGSNNILMMGLISDSGGWTGSAKPASQQWYIYKNQTNNNNTYTEIHKQINQH